MRDAVAYCGPAAYVWRINHGWRAHGDRSGFALDTQTGRWGQQQSALSDNDDDDIDADAPLLTSVKPFGQDAGDILPIKHRPSRPAHPWTEKVS